MDHFLSKPFQKADLVEVLATAVPVAPVVPHEPVTPLSVLVVEDNAVNQKVTGLVLESMGHRYSFASNGKEAVEAALGGQYDLVLMDCQMPIMDGYQATIALRGSDQGRKIPIIALTAQTLPGDRERCLASGMDGYTPKPFGRDSLSAEIQRVLRERAASRSPDSGPSQDDIPLLSEGALEQLRAMSRTSPGTVREIVELFRTEGLRIVAELRAAADGRDEPTFARLRHELLGSSAMVGAARVTSFANSVKDAARAGDFVAVSREIDHIERTILETHRLFRRALGAPSSP
jgi:CheY-like chemotaxis protein/HPt (histidine-containing phosphotransfer) domain-containing protein